jgi:hypothetical protein
MKQNVPKPENGAVLFIKGEILRVEMLAFIIYLVAGLILINSYLGTLKSLPSPMYGGDLYYQMGAIWHIMRGGEVLGGTSMANTVPGYLPGFGFLVAEFSTLMGYDAFTGMLKFALIVFLLSNLAWYLFFRELAGKGAPAIMGTIALTGLFSHPMFKYTDFTFAVAIPLFLLFLYRALKSGSWKDYAIAGAFYGILAVFHVVAFVGATLIAALIFIWKIYSEMEYRDVEKLKKYAAFSIVALPVLMMYWYRPVFQYGLQFAYDRTHMELADFSAWDNQMAFVVSAVQGLFADPKYLISALIVLAGIGKLKGSFPGMLILGSIFATFCYFITEPIIHMNFIPDYMQFLYLVPSIVIAAVFLLEDTFSRFGGAWKIGSLLAVFLLMYGTITAYSAKIQSDQWILTGKNNDFAPEYVSLGQYLRANTSVNDVFLSTKELSFALNSVSGGKLVVNRWAQQNNQYLDMPSRDRDAAVMLYGKNDSERVALLKEYNVSYVFVHGYWYYSEYVYNQNDGTLSPYDPLVTVDNATNRQILDLNGVQYNALRTWLDPSGQKYSVRKYDVLQISDSNYDSSGLGPWNDGMDSRLKQAWAYYQDGRIMAALYKVNYSN